MPCRSAPEKSDKEITSEIQAIIRQITASVTFLPLLNDACEYTQLSHLLHNPAMHGHCHMGLHSAPSGHVQHNIHMSPLYRQDMLAQPASNPAARCIWHVKSNSLLLGQFNMCSANRGTAGTFDLLVYTDAASSVPTEWEDSDPRFIQNAADVKLRSFTTKVRMVAPTQLLAV